MTSSTILYLTSVFLTFALTGLLAWVAWRRRPVLPGVRMYGWLALGESLLALDEILSMTSPTQAQAHFFFNLRFLFTGIIAVFFLVFSLEYLGRKNWITTPLLIGAFIIPALSQFFIWIPGLNGLWVKQDVGFLQSGSFWIADISLRIPGVWFLVHSFYSFALLLAGMVVILLAAWQKRQQQRGQALLLAGGALVALVTGLIPVLNLFPKLAFNPFIPGIGISAGLYALAVFRFQFLKRSPAPQSASSNNPARLEESHSLAVFIFIFLLFATGIAAIGFVSYQNYEDQYRQQVNAQLTSVTALKVNQLENWRTERLGDADVLYDNPVFSGLVQSYLGDPGNAQAGAQLQAWLDSIQKGEHYEGVFLLDAHAVERLASPEPSDPVSPSLAGQAVAALGLGQVTFMDFYRDSPTGPIYISLLVPVYAGDDHSRRLGVVVLRVDPSVSLYPFIQQWPTSSTTAETLLVRRDGDNALFLNQLRFNQNAALSLRIPLADNSVLAVKAVLGQTGIVQGTDYRRVPALGYVGAVPGSPWFLVARMDSAEVYAPLRERLWEMLAFFGVLILAAGAGLLLLWRQQGIRYYRRQVESLDALRLSEEKYRSLFDNSEVGMYRTRLDGSEILDMNEKYLEIFGRTRAEMQGTSSVALWADPLERQAFAHQLEAQGRIVDFECMMLNKQDEVRRCLTSARLFPQEGILEGSMLDITERKQAEQALQESEARYRHALDDMLEGCQIIGFDWRYLYLNNVADAHNRRPKEELLGQRYMDMWPGVESTHVFIVMQKCMEERSSQSLENEFVFPDGRKGWFDLRIYPVPEGIVVLSIDMTERKQAENMLHARLRLVEFAANHSLSELLRQTLDEVCAITNSPIGFYDFVEPDQKTLSHQTWSTRTLQEYCQAKGSDEHFNIDDAGVWVDCIRQRKAVIHNDYASLPHRKGLPAGHAPLIRELVVPIFRDDLIVAILGIGNRAQKYTAKDVEVVSFFADVAWEITLRKQAEETLRESESRFHSLFVNMLNGFAYCQMLVQEGQPLDFIYLDVNHAFGTLTGLKDVVGKKASEAIPGIQASDPELLERYARVSRTGIPESFETYVEALKMWFSISVYSPRKGYFVAVFDVITDRKRAEQELQAYSEYLETMVNDRTRALEDAQEKMVRTERLATLGQLAGSVGHELRNPLGVISNAVYFLKMTQPDANPTILDYLDIIEKETKTSDKIVTDLLDFTRIKSVDREPATVSDLFAQTLQRYRVPAGVEVSTELPPDLPQVYADARQVVQVLGNLVTNACQAMSEPQTRLTTEDAPPAGKLTLSAALQGDMIAIAVHDTGMGIPPENMGKLFEPLFTTKTKGIGLGLAVSQKLTEANGGSIEAHSQPGQGSTFTIYLPAYTQVVE